MLCVLVASAQAAAAGMMPRANGFSANQIGVDAGRFRGPRLLDALLRRQPPCSRTLSLGSFANGARNPRPLGGYTPPGRGPESAGEKCACTTRHWPSSLRNTMVEREMNSLLS